MEMYKRVLEDELQFPSQFDSVTCNFLSGLLEKEACERLGWGEDGIEEIMLHPYFNSIDWNLVPQKKLIPTFIPKIKNEEDLTHFDTVFTNLPVKISQSSSTDTFDSEQDPFQNFSFDPTTATSNNSSRIKKRHSTALFQNNSTSSSLEDEAGPSRSSHHSDHRIFKKRQMNNDNIMQSPTISTLHQHHFEKEEEEESSSIYSRSSLTFSFGGGQATTTATRAGSELSIETNNTIIINQLQQNYATTTNNNNNQPSPYERPNCPIPGQTRNNYNLPHSNTSTLANSMCSYLDGNNVVQQ
jgi:hypothetical protein